MNNPEDNLNAIDIVDNREMSKEGLERSLKVIREYRLAKDQYTATAHDNFLALALAIRDRLVRRWILTQQRYHKTNVKRVYYLSMEFLIGRLMGNNIINLGLWDQVKEAMEELGFDLEELREQEVDAGLGNGGLGRLAACFLDSMATLGIPAHGYGIRYDYGIFHQKIENGHQIERPDGWLRLGNPWEFARPEYTVKVQFYGRTKTVKGKDDKLKVKWVDTEDILAMPYDIPIPGYKNDVVNTLRLWSAKSGEAFDFEYFNDGDYERAVYQKMNSENISKVLYPNDNFTQGRELRLKQEYFFTAAAISDIIRRFKSENSNFTTLPEKVVIQLNDTHPTLAIVELMRVLLDEQYLEWNTAWNITTRVFAYTNHTLMPEALETWSVPLFQKVLPRHLEIIYEINAQFLNEVAQTFPGDEDRIGRMSVVEEGQTKRIRMAYLAIIGSFSINGVSALHSQLLKEGLFKDFYELSPDKFNNKTNGITPRRWLYNANRRLSDLITETIGDKWVTNLNELEKLLPFKDQSSFREEWRSIKTENKEFLANYIHETMRIKVNPDSLFDVQVKRIHEYKRQLLLSFYIISQYLKIKADPKLPVVPRTFILGGKAAPGYFMAKLIIKFINNVAKVINKDKDIKDKMKVIFMENYRVSLAEKIFPASNLSEQISTSGTEASGTGNMKFMLNGALTIGTLDGANIEMAEAVGLENMFIFGLKAEEVKKLKDAGYDPKEFINRSSVLKEIFQLIRRNVFSPHESNIFDPILQSVTTYDPFLICADFDAYCKQQDIVSEAYKDKTTWTQKSIINVAKSGRFSSDRTIQEYAKELWSIPCS